MSRIHPNATVGSIVAERPSRSRVFEAVGIDYCCGGKRPLAEACTAANLDLAVVLDSLEAHDRAPIHPTDERNWLVAPLNELIDNILETHHVYLRREMPRLTELTAKVASAHGTRHAWTKDLHSVFADLRAELEAHMAKEEQILFPMCRELEGSSGPTAELHCGSVENPIRVMEMEHDSAARALRLMREMSSGYAPPTDACNTFRALLDGLTEFEADLHEHVHKENNILFPRVCNLEATLGATG